jgi:hypothetical protein
MQAVGIQKTSPQVAAFEVHHRHDEMVENHSLIGLVEVCSYPVSD